MTNIASVQVMEGKTSDVVKRSGALGPANCAKIGYRNHVIVELKEPDHQGYVMCLSSKRAEGAAADLRAAIEDCQRRMST